jgi:hypothetical protein
MNKQTSPEEITHQLEFAKLDYTRLGTQEQALMNKREGYWTKFFTILLIPSGYAGVVGLHGAVFVLALVPFFLTCLSLEIKHDEQVLRYDVRKQMKLLAQAWGFANHDSNYSNQDGSRFWHGYYKRAKAASFIMAGGIAAAIVSLSVGGLAGLGLLLMNVFFTVVTFWCLL